MRKPARDEDRSMLLWDDAHTDSALLFGKRDEGWDKLREGWKGILRKKKNYSSFYTLMLPDSSIHAGEVTDHGADSFPFLLRFLWQQPREKEMKKISGAAAVEYRYEA